ncbi:synaptophysin-like protein 2a [Chanos chanos]|uniref:Synaptophysin-like protein 2a n=1 Tax=Chanos chanos TaxID=29144 RepID=A0A6J2VP39_CHACN|nr:synaptophysin-like protein 1 [Chanos chanos]
MDIVQKLMSGFTLDLGPVKEPLGFIRVLEWIFTIFAFATTGGYTGVSEITANCNGTVTNVSAQFYYPFRLQSHKYSIPNCNGTNSTLVLTGDFSSSPEFFVCVGVFGFLYCTATLILYIGYQHVYRETSRGPVIDFFITAIFAFLWLAASSAWAKGLSDVKNATNPSTLINECKKAVCKIKEYPAMGRLNASVIFGFLNLILWAGNCWFIYKETPFHRPANPPPAGGAPGP